MNILVTGGAGFIGSNFIFYELEKHPEDRVICLDKLTYAGNLSTLKGVIDRPQFLKGKGRCLAAELVRDERDLPEFFLHDL